MSTMLMDAPPAVVPAESWQPMPPENPARRGPILLATDGTGPSGAPVTAARMLSEQLGLPLEVVSVLEPDVLAGAALGGSPVCWPEIEDARRKRRLSEVHDYVARFSGGEAPPRVFIRYGAIADEIARAARERSATIVVVGSSPHQRLSRVIAGERAVNVLRSSSVPVLSVAPGFSALPRNIVVAIDFSPSSIRAAQTALLLLADGGTLTLLHVLSPLLDLPIHDIAGYDIDESVQELFDRLRDEMRPYTSKHVTIETRMRTADATSGILAVASGLGAEVVGVGTHGPRLLERIFVGSVASSVIHAASQTVLAAPPPPENEARALWHRMFGPAFAR